MIIKTHIDSSVSIIAKDRCEVRVLVHPLQHANKRQSIAKARLYAGHQNRKHQHLQTEETYHFISGTGKMTVGTETTTVGPGDTVVVLPGLWHQIEADSGHDLEFYSCCTPAYMPEDTALAPEPAGIDTD